MTISNSNIPLSNNGSLKFIPNKPATAAQKPITAVRKVSTLTRSLVCCVVIEV